MIKIIVGPVTKEFIEVRRIKRVKFITINTEGDCDICYSPGESIFDIIKKLPWQPDYMIFLYPEYNVLPKDIEKAPFITVAIICDWNINFHIAKNIINFFDVILTDKIGVELFKKFGHNQVFHWSINCFNPKIHKKLNIKKVYDIVFVGNLNPVIQRDRKKWLKNIAKLSNKYKIKICGGIYGDEYTKLLNKAKIVFNRSIRGEMNCRVYETLACGSLLFMEEENKEIQDILIPFKHYVPYNKENIDTLIEYYITHKNEREKIANNGYKKIQKEKPKNQWQKLLDIIKGCKKLDHSWSNESFLNIIRIEQAIHCPNTNFEYINNEFNKAYKKKNHHQIESRLNNDIGVIYTLLDKNDIGVEFLRRAINLNPYYIIPYCNLAKIIVENNKLEEAKKILDYVIKLLETETLEYCDGLLYPWEQNEFKIKYETIGYSYIENQDKQTEEYKKLWLYRCYDIYGDIFSYQNNYEKAIYYYTKAINLSPDLSTTKYKLAKIYEVCGKKFNAIEEYKNYLEYEPLDFTAVLSLCDLIYKTKNFDELKNIVDEYLIIGKAFREFKKYKNKFLKYVKN